VSVALSDEPEIELTATNLNLQVQDAGKAALAGIYSGGCIFNAAAFALRRAD